VAESQEIHQIEYRWQPTKDMSAVASSMSPESFRSWVQRIGPWVRHPGVDAPTDSVRYEMFGDRAAALAWRQRDRQAVEFEDGQDGRPLASRVLLGPADLLTPEVAMAVCYAGLPRTIGPRPGTVTAGAALPPVAAVRLAGLVQDNAEALDLAAAQEAGLERVVAAALSDRDTPLSVQLPERIIVRSPRGGSQALLLWGLRRTVGPLLGHADGRRGWSFSTFELPLSDMDPETLPDIVFRLAQAAPQAAPMTTRKEIRVRPQDPIPAPVETVYQHLARLLVAAYRDHGGDELNRVIVACAGDLSSADRRIQAVYNALDDSLPAVTVISEGPGKAPARVPSTTPPDDDARVESATPPASVAQGGADQESAAYFSEVAQPVTSSAVVPGAPPPQPAGPAVPPERRQPETPRLPPANLPPPVPSRPLLAPQPPPILSRPPLAPQPPPVPSRPPLAPQPSSAPPTAAMPIVSAGRSSQDAPRLFAGESQRVFAGESQRGPTGETPLPATLSALLALLSAGPASPRFKSAFQALCATNFQSGPDDRAVARKLICDHGWYVDVFRHYDQVQFEDMLVMIFWHTVLPDLAERQVVGELQHWADKLAAPTVVIRALYKSTDGADGTWPLMDRALRPALAWRWLNENEIHVPAAQAPATTPPLARDTAGSRDTGSGTQGAAAPQTAAQPSDGPPTLQSMLDRKVTVPLSLVLAVCVAVIVLLVVTPR
jgi:hypothetical protein